MNENYITGLDVVHVNLINFCKTKIEKNIKQFSYY